MSWLVRFGALAALLAASFVVAACGKTVIDHTKQEEAVESNLKGSLDKPVTSVDCPSDVEVKAGATFECTVSLAGGKEETATLKIVNDDADVEITDLSAGK